ncbi:hypothetical protein QFZ91_002823 [Paraburkholderia sp. JPY419]
MKSRLFGSGNSPFLPPAAFFGRAGLVVDQHGHAVGVAQLALHGVHFAAMVKRRALRKLAVMTVVFLGLVADHDEARHAFGFDLSRDLRHRDAAVDGLTARHRDRVVIEDLVGDRRFRGDRLANRENARVKVGAVAEILEYVAGLREHRMRRPVDAFAAHLNQSGRVALHPRRHEMTADAGLLRDRTVRHFRRRVVRTAGAEVRRALHAVGRVRQDLRRDQIDDAFAAIERRLVLREPVREHRQNARRPQFAERRQQQRAIFGVLADHDRPRALHAVVQIVLDLLLDDGALLFDHEYFGQARHERVEACRLQRKRQPDLVDAHAGRVEIGDGQIEPAQRFHQIEMRLAARDDADVRVRARCDPFVDAVDARKLAHRVELRVQTRFDRQARQIGPAVVQTAGWCFEFLRWCPFGLQRVEIDGRARFDGLRNRLVADPRAREARQRPAVQAELEHVRDVRRIHHRHMPRHHREVALMGHRRRHAAVIVAGDHQHAAVRRRAVRVAMLQRIARAVDARALAVPHREYAIDGTLGIGFDALRAEHGGAAEFFVDRGQKADIARGEQFFRLPQLLIDHAERRAAIAADEAGGVQAAGFVERALHQREAHERLGAGQKDPAARRGEIVGKLVVGESGRAVDGQASGHGGVSNVLARRAGGGVTDTAQRKRLYFLALAGVNYCFFNRACANGRDDSRVSARF